MPRDLGKGNRQMRQYPALQRVPRQEGAVAMTALPSIATGIVSTVGNIIATRTRYRDRCHQRETYLAAAQDRIHLRDNESARRSEAFVLLVKFASELANGHNVDQAVKVVESAAALMLSAGALPELLPVFGVFGGD